MKPALDHAYTVLDNWSRSVTHQMGVAGDAQVDRQAAIGREALAAYGIDLTDDSVRDAVVATLDVVVQALVHTGVQSTGIQISFLQQAAQRANAIAAKADGT